MIKAPQWKYLKPAEHNAEVDYSSPEGMRFRTSDGKIFGMLRHSPNPNAFSSLDSDPVPERTFQHALNEYLRLNHAIHTLVTDRQWSPIGRYEKARAAREYAMKSLAAVNKDLQQYDNTTSMVELHHYAVPDIEPSNILAYLKDQEIRIQIRELGDQAPAKLVRALSEFDNPALALAILRAPLPMEALERLARQGWHDYRDRLAPENALTIKSGREQFEWADSIVKTVAGKMTRELLIESSKDMPGLTREEFYAMAKQCGGEELFRFSESERAARAAGAAATAAA